MTANQTILVISNCPGVVELWYHFEEGILPDPNSPAFISESYKFSYAREDSELFAHSLLDINAIFNLIHKPNEVLCMVAFKGQLTLNNPEIQHAIETESPIHALAMGLN